VTKEPWVDELERANDCANPLGLHTLQLLPELSDGTVRELQEEDSVIGLVRSWLALEYEPTIDDLRQLPPENRKLWSLHSSLSLVNQVLIRKVDSNYQLIVPDVLKR